jgi:RNAse (barnase) inhibitor barstar
MRPAHWLTVTTDPAPAVVDGRACRTRAAFFAEAARVLEFPDYFGRNWDALVDCLRDVGPLSVIVAHAEHLLADEPPVAFATLLDIMATAAADGLLLTLFTDPHHETSLRERITTALNQP